MGQSDSRGEPQQGPHVWWLAGAGVATGLGLMIWVWARAASMSADGAHYMELAERASRLGAQAGMDWYAGPGYPVSVARVFGLVGDLAFAGRLTSLLFGLSTLVGLGVLAFRLFGGMVAALATAMLAVHTTFVRHAIMAETDSAYACWLVWSILLVWELKHARAVWLQAVLAALAGLTLGVGYLTRPEALPLAGLLAVWYLLPARTGAGQAIDEARCSPLASRIAWAIVVAAVCATVAAPYLLKLRRDLGRWSLSGKERSIVLKFVPDKRNYEESLKLGVTRSLLNEPSNFLHWLPYHLRWGLPQFVKSLHPVVLVLATFGLLRRRVVREAPGATRLLLWVSVPFIVFFFLTFPGRRYFMQAMPQWTVLAAAGAVELAARLERLRARVRLPWDGIVTSGPRRVFGIALTAPLCLLAALTGLAHLKPLESSRIAERRVGERILDLAGPGRRVLSFTITAFYARAQRVPLWGPMEGIVRCHGYGRPLTYEDLLDYVRHHSVEFVVMDHDLRKDCPEFLDRVSTEDFELVADNIWDNRGPCLVYRCVGQRTASPTAN